MRRVLVVGSGGAGKSTFAARLGAATGLPVVHLDAAFWRPGWVEPAEGEWQRIVADLVARDAWIMDGNFGGTLDVRLAACDTAIFLDRSRWLCLLRIFRRLLRYRGRSRPDMAPGCAEGFDLEFLRWVWNFPTKSRPQVVAKLAAAAATRRVVTLRSDREVDRFLSGAARG
ncbi:MAG: DNA topology modulation protein [Planctomycetes bacterium]|nr:DNA topology modulation protein [Planctomycetota bacterium]